MRELHRSWSSVTRLWRTLQADELWTVDDMAERCDKLEQEMLMRDGGSGIDTRSKSSTKSGDSLVEGSM